MRYPRLLRFALSRLLLAGLMLFWSAAALVSAPANDTCSGAFVVPGGGPFPYLSPVVTNINEATSSGDPAVPSANGCDTVSLRSGGVWYAFTPATSGVYHLSFSGDTATTVIDTLMAVYQSANSCAGPFVPVDCNDDQGERTSALEISLTANIHYYILVWAAFATPPADAAAVQLRVARPTVPGNDTCAGAEVISPDGPFPYLTEVTDMALAGTTGNPPKPNCAPGNLYDGTVWYRFAPTQSRTLVVSTCDDTRTTLYDTLLAIYSSSSGCGSFTQVACSDTTSNTTDLKFRGVITNTFNAGTTYYFVVGDPSGEGITPGETLVQLRLFEPRPPTVNLASSITPTSAVFNATIPTFNTALVKARFEWGLTTSYGNLTPLQSVRTGTNDLRVSAFVSSLTTNAYHYRLVLTNCFGVARSLDQQFMWSNIRPILTSAVNSNGFRVQFNGNPGQRYTILSSGALPGWQDMGPATDLGNGNFEYRDSNFLAPSQRFFQIRSP